MAKIKEQYRRQTVKAGRTVDVSFTYPTRFGDELTRSGAKNIGTPVAMMNYNRELAIRELTRILNANFDESDWFVTLHYEKNNRPDRDTAKKQLNRFVAKLRKLYRDSGVELKIVKSRTSVGERGAVHHHIVITGGIEVRKISAIWKSVVKASNKSRPPDFKALYDGGDYSSLAAYIYDQSEKEGTAKPKNERRWTCSRNCVHPKPQIKTVSEIKWNEPPIAWKGYYIDNDSVRVGCNPINGRPYLFYRMIKLPPNWIDYDDDGKRVVGKEAIRLTRERHKKWLSENWDSVNPEGNIVFRRKEKNNND